MEIFVKQFSEFSIDELYAILKLRSKIFVVEQTCIYQDLDGKDQKALHIYGIENNEIAAYARLFKPGDYFDNASIGRVLIAMKHRKKGLAHQLIQASILSIQSEFNTQKITISAQKNLHNFYRTHGFLQVGDAYLEDGIPHIEMQKLP